MKIKYEILSAACLFLIAGGLFQSCREDDFNDTVPDRATLVAQGRYLRAVNAETVAALEDPDRSKYFEVGTPYRLVAFTKAYYKDNVDDETPAETPRFSKVALESEATGALRYINLDEQPDKWLGFNAMEGETGGSDDLVSLDFYGFTYGKKQDRTPDYIELDGMPGEQKPAAGSLTSLRHREDVTDGELADLMRGMLLNQNIVTAGQYASVATQSIIPFRHCFSRLRFMVVQQSEENADGDPVPCFGSLSVESVNLTGTYGSGYVYLHDGKVELPETADARISRNLKFDSKFTGDVTIKQVEMGSMVVFPSYGDALRNAGLTDGYDVGLEIKVKSSDKAVLERILANTNPEDRRNIQQEADGTYSGVVIKDKIIDNYTNLPIRFRQNTAYTLVISFQQNQVRIITVIPQLEEWLPGEGTDEDPWQEQPLGQPQMFDNVVWSDRNLGADHYDPMGEQFERTIGYFYQSGRNIPYYPFDSDLYYDNEQNKYTSHPSPYEIDNSVLADVNPYYSTRHRFYPIVDPRILKMKNQMSGRGTVEGNKGNDRTWMIGNGDEPQMYIPESMPEKACYDFMRSVNNNKSGLSYNTSSGQEKSYDMHWEAGQKNQPVHGAWVVPSSSDFMKIFPSTPHAGNITFRGGGNNADPMNWGWHPNNMNEIYKVLRVTVPYYVPGMLRPSDRNAGYISAWETLEKNNDIGTTNLAAYGTPPGTDGNRLVEPDGDPEDGYASTYVLSREDGCVDKLSDDVANPNNKYTITSWGTIYAIKRVYTPQAYRMRWRVVCAGAYGKTKSAGLYVEICRYRCSEADKLTEENYKSYDWEHPAARLYFPICGLGDWTGNYINFGTECEYAASDPIVNGKCSALQIKITGDNNYNAYMAIIRKPIVNRDFGKQIRPVMGR